MNISAIRTYLLGSVIVGVKFKLNPTVLYAEKHSKATVNRGVPFGSKINKSIIEIPIEINEIHKIAKALEVDSLEILLPNISILLLPFATANIFKEANAKVLVLIPPAVEAGEPPIHIKKIITNNEGTVILAKSTALNPAVLGVTELNAAAVIFPKVLSCSNKVLLYSEINKKTKPPINKTNVV